MTLCRSGQTDHAVRTQAHVVCCALVVGHYRLTAHDLWRQARNGHTCWLRADHAATRGHWKSPACSFGCRLAFRSVAPSSSCCNCTNCHLTEVLLRVQWIVSCTVEKCMQMTASGKPHCCCSTCMCCAPERPSESRVACHASCDYRCEKCIHTSLQSERFLLWTVVTSSTNVILN